LQEGQAVTITPVRIKLHRTARWRLQAASLALNGLPGRAVTRPGPYGNPWTVAAYYDAGYRGDERTAAQHCVDAHLAWLEGRQHWAHSAVPPRMPVVPDLTPLRGHNLACHCALGMPCHADNLLLLANAPR
jgi:hypothetical protein